MIGLYLLFIFDIYSPCGNELKMYSVIAPIHSTGAVRGDLKSEMCRITSLQKKVLWKQIILITRVNPIDVQ